jgi:predicted ArsR family transcriptional regulator
VRLRAMTAAKLRRANERMTLLCCKSATEKVSYFLLETDRRSDSTCRLLDLLMSRTDMANYLGLTTETVCRTLAHLRRDGVLPASPAGIELRDRPAYSNCSDRRKLTTMPRTIASLAMLIVAGCQAHVQQPDMAGARPSFQTLVEKDADAIMEGIRQARRSPLDQHMRVAHRRNRRRDPPNTSTKSKEALNNPVR